MLTVNVSSVQPLVAPPHGPAARLLQHLISHSQLVGAVVCVAEVADTIDGSGGGS